MRMRRRARRTTGAEGWAAAAIEAALAADDSSL
jgi:hypothetical protein